MGLDIETMIHRLDIMDIPLENAIREIFRLSRNNNLPLYYFDNSRKMFGAKRKDALLIYVDKSSVDGYTEEWVGHEFVEQITNDVRLPQLEVKQGSNLKWDVVRFYIGSDEFYITDDTGHQQISVEISYKNIFCYENDLEKHLPESSKTSSARVSLKDKKAKLVSIISAYNGSAQEWYESIGSLTKPQLKTYLQKEDSDTFTFNLDNLIRSTPKDFGFKLDDAKGRPKIKDE
jgi:hypothetical protein